MSKAFWDQRDPRCANCRRNVHRMREFAYMVIPKVWTAATRRAQRRWPGAGFSSYDLCCIGCFEERLGRPLAPWDFDWGLPLNDSPDFARSKRLKAAMTRWPQP